MKSKPVAYIERDVESGSYVAVVPGYSRSSYSGRDTG